MRKNTCGGGGCQETGDEEGGGEPHDQDFCQNLGSRDSSVSRASEEKSLCLKIPGFKSRVIQTDNAYKGIFPLCAGLT